MGNQGIFLKQLGNQGRTWGEFRTSSEKKGEDRWTEIVVQATYMFMQQNVPCSPVASIVVYPGTLGWLMVSEILGVS